MKRKYWLSVLDKHEMKHLRQNFKQYRYSKWSIQHTLRYQAEHNIDCYECKCIARKLGVTLDAKYS